MTRPHELIVGRYADERAKQRYLRELFDRGAPHYDRMGRIGSFGTGHAYRKRALRRAGLQPGLDVLDVACGTGAVTRAVLEILGGQGSVVGLDPSEGMLAQARARVQTHFVVGEAERLPFPDSAFDFLTMGYALRHVEDLGRAFAEYHRVLKPGGKVVLLEITRPKGRLSLALARFCFRDLLPLLATVTGGGRDAREMMVYYWETIDACVAPDIIIQALRTAGFEEIHRHVEAGIFSEYRGLKPAS